MARTPVVDKDACISCGLCPEIAPGTFKFDEDEKAYAYNPKGETEEKIQEAIDSCPVEAISWKEE
ncbi:MAG TPA: ferredoxin [Nitrospirota bacterium]|jgi:ferredoxin